MVFKKKKEGEEADPAIWRGGRAYYKTVVDGNKKDLTYKDLGRVELLRLFRKIKPHTSDAIKVMLALMNKESAEDTVRLRAATAFLSEYRAMVKDIYDSDELANPESELSQNKPAAVLHLEVVRRLDNALEAADKASKDDNSE